MQRAFAEAKLKNALHIVTNGEEAIDYIAGRNAFSDREKFPLPDMIFLDLKMPGIDGFGVLSWLQNQKSEIPVAVLTSSPEEIDVKRVRELGADCYLLKPPTPSMVLGCCRQFELQCLH
jgi:CheY-like chemotaxis protein